MTPTRKQASFPNANSTTKRKQRQEHDDEHQDKPYCQDPAEFARVRDSLLVLYPHLVLPLSTTVDPRPKWPAWVDPSPVSSSTRSKSKAKSSEAPSRPTFLTPVVGRFDYEIPEEYDSDEDSPDSVVCLPTAPPKPPVPPRVIKLNAQAGPSKEVAKKSTAKANARRASIAEKPKAKSTTSQETKAETEGEAKPNAPTVGALPKKETKRKRASSDVEEPTPAPRPKRERKS